MHYQKEIWRGQHTLTLTEDAMTLRLLPERGGKAASLQWRGVELLAQPRGEAYPPLRPDMPFHEGDASGFDDVFPSMGGAFMAGKARYAAGSWQAVEPSHDRRGCE